jgi:Rrf2 family transcriptional regulator, cysteine metabolism repressor
MKLSTRARYGIRALLDLAGYGESGPVSLKDIADRQEISMSYLEHLINPLVAGGIIRTVRGSKGGIVLSKPATQIKLSDVVELLEGSTAPVDCVDCPGNCRRSEDCVTRDVWVELKEAIDGVLSSITLQELVERQKTRQKPVDMFYI